VNKLHQISKTFHGKLLLAGEYTVLEGGSSLAIPFSTYESYLHVNAETQLTEFWLKLLNYFWTNGIDLNFELFKEDISHGLDYHSSIPVGYGVGSSGALVASLFDRYKLENFETNDLQSLLGEMESYFHGKSSGIDPFVIFMNKAIYTKGGKTMIVEEDVDLSNWYLIDSHKIRTTAEYVNLYRNDIKHLYEDNIEELTWLNEGLINCFLKSNHPGIILKQISSLQLEIFEPMIPSPIRKIWEQGLADGRNIMKLCGAGGGGFFLVYGDGVLNDQDIISLANPK
jgi:mevalonate kinase